MKSVLLLCAILALVAAVFGFASPLLISMSGDIPVLIGIALIPATLVAVAYLGRALVRRAPVDLKNFQR